MKRMSRICRWRYLKPGVAMLAVVLVVVALPVLAWCEALTPEQARARAEARADTPEPAGPPDRVSVLLHVQPGADRGPLRAFTREKGGIVKYEYKTVLPNVMNLRNIPVAALPALEKIPGVIRIEEDKYHPNLIKLDESTPLIRALQSQITGADLDADGSGLRVCVCDTGIDMDHVMYADRIHTEASWDFVNNDNNPDDDHGHGAHVAGIAVGGTGLEVNFGECDGDEPFQGVAPGATLIGVKVLDQFGGGYDGDVIAGIDRCVNYEADVINLSLGKEYSGTCDEDLLATAANNAVNNNGVVVVAAAGNEGYTNALLSPACGSNVIAVGATYKDNYPNCEDDSSTFFWSLGGSFCVDEAPDQDALVCFSNQNDYLDVVAPGAVIWSASTAAGGNYITEKSGTSMASPHVAGLAALVLDRASRMDLSLTPQDVRQYIRGGAIDMGPTDFDPGYGFGRIDVINTLSLLQPEICGDTTCGPGEDPCNCPEDCGTPPSAETSCNDGVDNDCDTFTDCDDSDCASDAACICDNDGVCEKGEDCNNCPNDCVSGGGGEPGCGNGVCEPSLGEDCLSCPADCRGKQVGTPKRQFCCGDGDGTNPIDCGDPRCSEEDFACSGSPPGPYCCGDVVCEGAENSCNCEIDCGAPPSVEMNCADGFDNDCDGDADCDDGDCDADPDCTCLPKGSTCTDNSECCSNKCKGKEGSKTCR